MEKQYVMVDLRRIALHSMDHAGVVEGEISDGVHTMTIHPWWEDCGATGETIECSCGFHSLEASGKGCWQWSHNIPSEHVWDELHKTLYDRAMVEAPMDLDLE